MLTKGCAKRGNLGLVVFIADGATNTEAAILEVLKASPGAKESRYTGDGDDRLLFCLNHLCFLESKRYF